MKRFGKKILLLLCMAGIFSLAGCGKDFDAEGYTSALLHLTFQGDTREAKKMIKGSTEESLMYLYQNSINTFTVNVITSQFDMSEAKQMDFAELVAKIFAAMRYEVTGSEKTGDKEYEVTVKIQPADIFETFEELLAADSEKMAEEIAAGKYTGTEEEIDNQIMADIINRSYELLDVAYSRVTYGDSETVVLRVAADEDGEYSINEEDMNDLIEKILRLDEM